MRRITALLLINLLIITKSSSINYCGAKMCGSTNAHTFCQFSEGPSAKCTGYIEAPLSDEDKARVMARLNRRRSDAASGRLKRLHPAGDMLKLRWVDELAREAQLWADQCRPPRTSEEHDVCRDLYSTTVGQCVASVVGEAPGLRVESMIDMWYMQSMLYKGNVTFYVLPPRNKNFYGDFGQMMWSKTYMVGCGRSRFMVPWRGLLRTVERLVCNFAPRGPLPARPLWAPAAPASACSARSQPDRSLTALCTYQPELNELYDIENSMTIEEHIALNTVLEIEGNESLNYHGSLDESYLTKLAIVTIEDTITEPYYNSVQKRDIPDMIALEDAKVDVYQIVTHKEVLQNLNATENAPQFQTKPDKSTKFVKKRISFIGRPKAYNMEELNDIFNEHNTENDHAIIADTSKNEVDLYAEYGLLELQDVNATAIPDSSTIEFTNEVPSTEENKSEAMRVMYGETSSSLKNITKLETTDDANMYLNTTSSLNGSQFKENAEDYLSDPETVRELQKALDHMEQTLEPRLSRPQGKVRRDLREIPPDIKIGDNRIGDGEHNSVSPEEIEGNKTIERGPMLNMVLKYMPYLKQYEKSILGKAVSKAQCVSPSFILVLMICL